MDFFKKIFSSKSKKYDQIKKEDNKDTRYMTDEELFVYHFVNKGGKFFYPDDMDDFKRQLLSLLKHLNKDAYVVIERGYFHFLKKLGVPVKFSFDKDEVLLGVVSV